MTDTELANALVATGVITNDSFRHNMYSLQSPDGQFVGIRYEAKEIVRDWRVCGAMMEKVLAPSKQDYDIRIERDITNDHMLVMISGYFPTDAEAGDNESLPRAISAACCAALGGRR